MTLIVSDVRKTFNNVDALRGVNFELKEKGQYAITGPSGSGKSTLMYLMGGLDRPTEGDIFLNERSLSVMNDEELARYRNEYVGFVFQFHFLLPSMSCMNNILLPSKIGGGKYINIKSDIKQLALDLGVEHCLKKYPYQLSGGEQQRINIIRALSLRPKLLLCDEPTGNLDSENTSKVTDLLKGLASEFESTLVVVTHDHDVAQKFESQIVIQDGLIK